MNRVFLWTSGFSQQGGIGRDEADEGLRALGRRATCKIQRKKTEVELYQVSGVGTDRQMGVGPCYSK